MLPELSPVGSEAGLEERGSELHLGGLLQACEGAEEELAGSFLTRLRVRPAGQEPVRTYPP